jgi:hypothetical protein
MRPFVFRLSASLLGVSVLLLLLWSLLVSAVPVRSSSSPGNVPARSGIITDTRWLELIRSGELESHAPSTQPMLSARLYDPIFYGRLMPLTPFTATLISSHPFSAVITGYASLEGNFAAKLASVYPGDTIVVTTPQQVMSLDIPLLTARIDRATVTVSGQAPPNALLNVYLMSSDRSLTVTATNNGTYTATFTDIGPSTYAWGILTYFETDGDQVKLDFAAPYWEVTLAQKCVQGIGEVRNAQITGTLQSATALTKGMFTLWPDYFAEAYYGCFTVPIQSTDRIMLSQIHGTIMASIIPTLTVQHDYAHQVLFGQTVPNHEVVAFFSDWDDGTYRYVWSDASGRYEVGTSDLSLKPGDLGRVTVTDDEGNIVHRNFTIMVYQYLPILRR